MKIGIDARLYSEAGIGRYISNLIKELEKIDHENEYIIFLNQKASNIYRPSNPNFKKWITEIPWYSFDEQTSFVVELMRARLDLLHVPSFNAPIFYPGKAVVTLHDLTMTDFSSADTTGLNSGMFMFKRFAYKLVSSIAAYRAKKIICPSETSKAEVLSKFSFVDSSKVVVTYEGVDTSLTELVPRDVRVLHTRLEEMSIKSNYFLYVGNAYPHKNLNNLIVSFRDLIEKHGMNLQLVIAGRVDIFSQRLAAFVHALKLDKYVVFAAKYGEKGLSVSDRDLAYLYKGAMAYVFPSLKEGFSITPLEAQAFGVPVVLSDIPTHKEIFKDSVAYFNPKSNIEMTEAISQIASDDQLRSGLTAKGTENVKRFSWSKMAEETLKVYSVLK